MTPEEKRKEKGRLGQLVKNFRERGATTHPRYLDALRDLDRLESRGLDIEKSRAVVLEAARRGDFVSMKMLADASGVAWLDAHYAIGGHLYALNCWAVGHTLPMIGAIVVNQENLDNGDMAPRTLKGFMVAARDLSLFPPKDDPGLSEEAFLAAEQRRVFGWAKGSSA